MNGAQKSKEIEKRNYEPELKIGAKEHAARVYNPF